MRLGIRRAEPIEPDTVVARSAPPEVVTELRAVYGLLSELPVDQRVALVLRRVDGLSVPEVAESMGLSVSTVKRRLKLAEARLERSLGR